LRSDAPESRRWLGFGVAFILPASSLLPSKSTNVLVWPFVWIGGPREFRSFIYTALLEYFLTQLKLAPISAPASSRFSDRGHANLTNSWRPVLYKPRARRPFFFLPI